ncbi:hypothetical protein ABIB25_002650 [Nakamurella sp. UYEF19]|uniref:hypothetical protein n=1 Tax=Nakamurella sp. UYEF19 TaxID=1756392 RepID=UPI0033969375
MTGSSQPQSDPMDPVRLQLLLTGVREVLGDLPVRPVEAAAGPRFRRTADSPLFEGLVFARSETPAGPERVAGPDRVAGPERIAGDDLAPAEVVSSPRLQPGGTGVGPLLNPVSLAGLIQRTR